MHDDDKLFEMLILEGVQAGLSWITVLRKRGAYRKVFGGFDIDQILLYDDAKIEELMQNAGIIRNRLKIWLRDHKRRGVPADSRGIWKL